MTASEAKVPIIAIVAVCGMAAGATLWRPRYLDTALLTNPMPTVTALVSAAHNLKAPDPKAPDATGLGATQPQAANPQASAKLESPGLDPSQAAPKPEPEAGAGQPPHFDVIRVEPTGDAVIAGKGDANAEIELLAGRKVIAKVKADANGHFVILPTTLAPGNYDLTLRQTAEGKPPIESKQSVAVLVPMKGGQVVVALAEPGRPTKLLTGPAGALPPVASTQTESTEKPPMVLKPGDAGLAIRSVELENGNGFFVSGSAAPGTHIQIYLNGTHLASVVAGPDGQWTVTLKKGLKGGHYAVRADAIGAGDIVTARTEVPFDVPVAMAQKAAEPSSAGSVPTPQVALSQEPKPDVGPTPRPDLADATKAAASRQPSDLQSASAAQGSSTQGSSTQGSSANAIVDEIETALVIHGDNLWNISRARLGHGRRFTEVYAANVSQIRDPKLIYPGQVFVVPTK